MKASDLIKELQFMIDNYGDVDVTIPEYIEENTSTEYHRYLKCNKVNHVAITNDEKYCTCISLLV